MTRGCPQHCDFCYKDAFFGGGRSFYTQRVDDALAEIARLPGRHIYNFSTIICWAIDDSGARCSTACAA